MPSQLKMLRDGTEGREKALCLFSGLESPHLLFAQSRGLVRIFSTIVQPFVLTVLHARQDFSFRRAITLQFIGDNHARNVLQFFKKLAKESFGSVLVASALHEDVEHIAVLVYCSPEVMLLATNREENLVHMPFVATTRATATEFISVRLPERANTIVERCMD